MKSKLLLFAALKDLTTAVFFNKLQPQIRDFFYVSFSLLSKQTRGRCNGKPSQLKRCEENSTSCDYSCCPVDKSILPRCLRKKKKTKQKTGSISEELDNVKRTKSPRIEVYYVVL